MKTFITLFTLLSIAFPIVYGHGFVSEVRVGGQTYRGSAPGASAKASPIRQINSINPIKGARNQATNCGAGAKVASQTVSAAAGSTISFKWSGGGGTNWPHNTGPMLVYAAKCNGPCNKFNSANAKWFKIAQVAKQGNQWAQQKLMSGGLHSAQIPSNLAPGEYLFKSEIIALHLAGNQGGAEFYEGCAQIKVTGSGTGNPSGNELVSMPGVYSDNDKGILVNAFSSSQYNFPGPAIAKLGSRSASLAEREDETEIPESEEVDTEEPSAEEADQPESENVEEHYPRVISRVMRGIQAN